MSFPPTLVLATRNEHKIRELGRICAGWPVRWITLRDPVAAEVPDVEETGATYLENAMLKATAVARALDLPAIADDSGIEVDALGGAPGPRSARYAGEDATDEENLRTMLTAIRGVPAGGRTARYRCVAAFAEPGGAARHAEGVCEGTLVTVPRGAGGFGYDPAFVPVGWDVTMAELTDAQKDRISHRGRAFRALGELLGAG
ncbi:MAG TPA: RdgB/HAM1 family non-canonical purine NTP pyrophosphatase [Actinomycetota bacterium]|nr:RdgB/HAM1 family non-canonical purine NTP pyrophosphatase [Actinomycetota bacterium]